MQFLVSYILYIYIRDNEVNKMALKNVNKIDENLARIYENQVTTNAPGSEWRDRSSVLYEQMNFIAMTNKSFLNLK